MSSFYWQFAILQVLLLFQLIKSTGYTCNIIPGSSSLTARNQNSTAWVSRSGDFAFGFHPTGKNGTEFLLAIWFNQIQEKTKVWYSNGHKPVVTGSTVSLTGNGLLVLMDPNRRPVWSTSGGASCAAMLDTGNFILFRSDGQTVWQSFDFPNDTLLPTQVLNQGGRLVARFSDSNYTDGRFQLPLQGDGNFVLYTTHFPLDSVNFPYYSTNTFGDGFRLVFLKTGSLHLVASNETILNEVFSNATISSSADGFYLRAVLDPDGVFRQYIYPKRSNVDGIWASGRWSVVNFIPSNICMRITEPTGSGACGFNGYCELREDRPECKCPIGYEFMDPNDKRGGCKQGFEALGCGIGGEKDEIEMGEMLNTDWPLSDSEHYTQVSEEWCREACLGDCLCEVAIFRNVDCWKKKMPLSNGRADPSVGGKALIKLRTANSTA